jgi:hypothetical protein
MLAVAGGLVLSTVGSAAPIAPLPFKAMPYTRGGMAEAAAQPSKPCNAENDGEEVLMEDGRWRCRKDPNGVWRWSGPYPA